MRLHAVFILGIILIGKTMFAADAKTETKPQFVRPFPIVVVPSGASDAHEAAAKKLADAIGVHVISEMPRNPVCCVWIEVTRWTPNPGEPGYVIINQGGGSIVSASDEVQLGAAVDRYIASIHKHGDEVEVPIGLMTSYRVVTAGG